MFDRIQSRREMVQLLNDRMNKTYSILLERQELEPQTSLVKTYLVEAHLSENAVFEEVHALLTRNFAGDVIGERRNPMVHLTQDESLFTLTARYKREPITIFVDSSNPRFWWLHSMNSSVALDWLVDRLVRAGQDLDSAWIPMDLLEWASKRGSFRGLGLDYDRRLIPDVDFEAPGAPVEFLKMQLWGNKADEVLRILRQEGAFPYETTLSKVKVKYWLSLDRDGEFSIDDVKYNGKVTARGTSFQSHVTFVSDLYRRYAGVIRTIEERFFLNWSLTDGRLDLRGEPVNFFFNRPIENLETFCTSLFSPFAPFRLWGVPIPLADDFYRVSAVDLHAGSRVDFEIAPEFIRAYLRDGSCGNSLVRLYTNLQHHYDAGIEAKDADGRRLFEF